MNKIFKTLRTKYWEKNFLKYVLIDMAGFDNDALFFKTRAGLYDYIDNHIAKAERHRFIIYEKSRKQGGSDE